MKEWFLWGDGFTWLVKNHRIPSLGGHLTTAAPLGKPIFFLPSFLSFFFFCNSCQVCSGAFNSSGLCHPFPKLCTLEKRMPDFPQALLDILTAFLLGERFLHHQHHFYILYNETADDKSILLITHPACYNPHKKHEQLEKP